MERRHSFLCVLLRGRLIGEIEQVRVPVGTQCVALKAASLVLVRNPELVWMTSLELDGLFIYRDEFSTLPGLFTYSENMLQEHLDLPVWVFFLLLRAFNCWILKGKTASEHLMTPICVWTKGALDQVVAVDWVFELPLELHLNAW